MRHIAPIIALLSVAMACATTSAFGDLVVDSWLLGTGVSSGSFSSSDASDIVENPYLGVLAATLGDSSTTASHNFSWSADSANFDVVTSQHARSLVGQTGTEGRIHLAPSVDSNITAWGTWQFAWPDSAEGLTTISFNVIDITDPNNYELVAIDNDHGGNLDLGPPFGSLNIQDSGTLLAGREYELFYAAWVTYFTTVPSGDAFGEFHFLIVPVPEPASLALLAAALFLLGHSRRRRVSRKPIPALPIW